MSSGTLPLSVFIIAQNEADRIGATIRAVRELTDDLVVVDSGSTDDTLAIVRRFPVHLIEIPAASFTYGRALNLGIKAAEGCDVAVSLSAHSLPAHERWLAHLVRNFADPRVAGVYGRQIPRPNASLFDHFGMNLSGVTSTRRRWQERDMMFSNANGAVRRALCLALPFDERLLGAEDLAWVAAVQRLGHVVVYEPAAPVYHSHGERFLHLLRRLAKDQPTILKLKLGMLRPSVADSAVVPEGSRANAHGHR